MEEDAPATLPTLHVQNSCDYLESRWSESEVVEAPRYWFTGAARRVTLILKVWQILLPLHTTNQPLTAVEYAYYLDEG
jgi:hypothetical protein